MEIVVAAHDQDEQVPGWHLSLQETLSVPSRARSAEQGASSSSLGDQVRVVGMPPGRAVFTSSRWGKGKLTMPLTQPEVIEAGEATREAVEHLLDRVGMGDESWKAHGRRD